MVSFFRRNKKEEKTYDVYNGKKVTDFDKETIERYKKSFWWTLIIQKFLVIPYKDIGENRQNAPYLKDIVKNDNNIYRRTLSTYLLFRENNTCEDPYFGAFWKELINELSLNDDDANEIRNEINHILFMQMYNEFFMVYSNLDDKSHDELQEELKEELKHITVFVDN